MEQNKKYEAQRGYLKYKSFQWFFLWALLFAVEYIHIYTYICILFFNRKRKILQFFIFFKIEIE